MERLIKFLFFSLLFQSCGCSDNNIEDVHINDIKQIFITQINEVSVVFLISVSGWDENHGIDSLMSNKNTKFIVATPGAHRFEKLDKAIMKNENKGFIFQSVFKNPKTKESSYELFGYKIIRKKENYEEKTSRKLEFTKYKISKNNNILFYNGEEKILESNINDIIFIKVGEKAREQIVFWNKKEIFFLESEDPNNFTLIKKNVLDDIYD